MATPAAGTSVVYLTKSAVSLMTFGAAALREGSVAPADVVLMIGAAVQIQ
jgi:hypothetical protein